MVSSRRFPTVFLSVFVGFVVLDQLIKAWSRNTAFGEGHVFNALWPNVFELKLAYNHGIAFGLFQGFGVVFAPIAILIAGYAAWHASRIDPSKKLMHFTIGMLAAGAVGNLIDRVWMGKVTDMFWFRLINFPVFNLADACITVSAVLLAVLSIRENEARRPESQVPQTDSIPPA